MATFRVKDLMINVIPKKFPGGGGSTGLCSADQATADHTPITPHTPVVMVANLTPKFESLKNIDQLDRGTLDQLATDIGRAAVGGGLVALCTQDMATCEGNARISPYASTVDFLVPTDFPALRLQMQDAVRRIEEAEHVLEERAMENRGELVPLLKDAVEALG